MATTKELEQRLDELEGQLGRLDELEERLARLEGTAQVSAASSETEQLAADKALVSRFANTRDEAIRQQAARERLAERGLIDAHGRLLPETDESTEQEEAERGQ